MVLNESQLKAIKSTSQKLLLIASAGSGKTAVLIEKVSSLVQMNEIETSSVLMLTFSNKAANQLKERLLDKIGPSARKVTIATFHGFALKIIKQFIEFTNLSNMFKIIDAEERNRYLATVANELKIQRYLLKEYKENFTTYKMGGNIPKQFETLHLKLLDKLHKMRMIEIDDLIPIAKKIITENRQVLEYIQKKYQYILVDEYQDINRQQFDFIHPIVESVKQFVAVGDDDQCIYEWRGSEPELMLELSREKDVEKIFLTQNYRSQGNIIEFSNKIISNNKTRIEKQMIPTQKHSFVPEFVEFDSKNDEAKYIAKKINNLYKVNGAKLDEIAILVRNENQGIEITKELRNLKLPFVNYNLAINIKKWILDYLKELSREMPDISKLINYPKNIIDKFMYEDLCEKFSLDSQQTNATVDYLYENNIVFDDCAFFRARYETAKRLITLKHTTSIYDVVALLCDDLLNSGDFLSEEELIFFNIAMSVAIDYVNLNESPTLVDFCDHFELVINEMISNSDNGIQIMTIHKSKGLEFEFVFIPGVEVGNFPNDFFVTSIPDMEAERRLLYVAITRAKEQLFISSGNSQSYCDRLKDGFLTEIKLALSDQKPSINYEKPNRNVEIYKTIIDKNEERLFDQKQKNEIDYSGFKEVTKNVILKWISNKYPMISREIQNLCENTEKIISDISRKMEPTRVTMLNNRSFIYGTLKLILDYILDKRANKVTQYLKYGSVNDNFELIDLHKELIKSKKVFESYAPNNLIILAEYKITLDSLHHMFEPTQRRGTKKTISQFNNKENYQKIELILSPIILLNAIRVEERLLEHVEQLLKF